MDSVAQSPIDPGAALRQAHQHLSRGDLPAAAHLCKAILSADAVNFDAWTLLGAVAAQSGSYQQAVDAFAAALRVDSTRPTAYSNLGSALAGLNRHEEALVHFDRALALQPASAEILYNRANALGDLGRLEEALESYDRALALDSRHAAAHNQRGRILRRLRRAGDAVESFRRATQINPTFAEAHCNLGDTLQGLARFEEALASYDRALMIEPDAIYGLNNRAIAHMKMGRFSEALAGFDQALALGLDVPEVYLNRAEVLRKSSRHEEAVASCERALKARAGFAEAHVSWGTLLYDRLRLPEAIDSFNRALGIRPGLREALESRGYARLMAGEYPAGWADHESRVRLRTFVEPQWRGTESLEGKTILLYGEYGHGDALQFCRYAPLVAARGARVILEVPQPLVALMKGLQGVAAVVLRGSPLPSFDYQCSLMSLPHAFGTELNTIPAQIPYLRVDQEKAALWAQRLGPRRQLRVGLVWAGGFRPHQPELWGVDARRNIRLATLAPLRHPAVEYFSLQKGGPAERELHELMQKGWDGPDIKDNTQQFHDFSDTAACIAQLDLVISVDTSTAHLAGALGKSVWLLNRYDTCWRWLTARSDSPWYPTLRIFRQPAPGDWDGVVAKVREALDTLA